jgi:leader peptidase (prepilin peptidase)/N-methyltransferase
MALSGYAFAACLTAGPLAGWLAATVAKRFAGETLGRGWKTTIGLAAAGTILFVWAWAVTPAGPVLLASLTLAWTLLTLAVVDVAAFRLPDTLTLPLCAAGLLLAWLLPAAEGWPDHVAGSIVGYGCLALFAWGFRKLRGYDGLGMGDAKLMGAAGAWLGWRSLPSVLLIGCLGGLSWWLAVRFLTRRPIVEARIQFGAPLCMAIWIVWLYGPLQIGA